MKTNDSAFDAVVLAGDIGGTNTNLALVGIRGGSTRALVDRRYRTGDVTSLPDTLTRFLDEARAERPDLRPDTCCIAGAGPIIDGAIRLTNASWTIDSRAVTARFGIPCHVINDFTAVSYGVALLDPETPSGQLRALPHPGGVFPRPDPDGVRAVLGAGTGLGVGYIMKRDGRFHAFPSEGGHIGLPVFDDASRDFSRWLERKYGYAVGAEAGISGQGIANAFAFLAERRADEPGPAARAILGLPERERPGRIAASADSEPLCAATMDLFVELYAAFASDATAMFLPAGGVFLAGGIAAKNENRLTAGDRFMKRYECNYREHIRTILARTPVYLVTDYGISLHGAALAAVEDRA